MTNESSKYERFDKSRTYRFLVWEPGAPEPIPISAQWDSTMFQGLWRARRDGDEGYPAATYTPFGAVKMVCDSAGIVIDEIATQAVIEREIEATKADLDAAVKHRDKARADCAQMEVERNKALCDLMNANADLASLRGEYKHTTVLLEEKSAMCANLTSEIARFRSVAAAALKERDEMIKQRDESIKSRDE